MATKDDYRKAGAQRFKAGEARPVGKPHWSVAAAQEGWDEARDAHMRGRQAEAQKSAPAPVSVASGRVSNRASFPGALAQFAVACHEAMERCRPLYWDQAQREHVRNLITILNYEHQHSRAEKLHRKILALLNKYHRKALSCAST